MAGRLRSLLGPGVVLATMSGLGDPRVARSSREAGCDRHLTKPVSLTDLEELLALAGGTGASTQGAAPRSSDARVGSSGVG